MKQHKGLFLIFLFLLFLLFCGNNYAQYQLTASVTGSGGGTVSGPENILSSTVGEVITGVSIGPSSQNFSGFWYVYTQSTVSSVHDNEGIPTVFRLEQNYPNPFNPSTTIKFAVPEKCNVLIKIYDILGGEAFTVADGLMEPGWYTKEFKASGFSSGIYIYIMQAGSYLSTKKMILLK